MEEGKKGGRTIGKIREWEYKKWRDEGKTERERERKRK